jgi:hypothetical protein
MGKLNGICADKNPFLQIGADCICAGFQIVAETENIVYPEKKVCYPHTGGNIGNIING